MENSMLVSTFDFVKNVSQDGFFKISIPLYILLYFNISYKYLINSEGECYCMGGEHLHMNNEQKKCS